MLRKSVKTVIALLLMLCFIIGSAVMAVPERGIFFGFTASARIYEGYCGQGSTKEEKERVSYYLDSEEGTLFITGVGEFYGQAAIPSTESTIIISNGITGISYTAFGQHGKLTSVSIPDSVTHIDDYAFHGCESLPAIKIPTSVTKIGKNVFDSCGSLKSIIIPSNIKSMGEETFLYCRKLSSVTIQGEIRYIGSKTFYGCSNLKTVNIPETVIHINNYAFAYCSNLPSIDIPNSVQVIGDYAFLNCSSIKSITIPDSVLTVGSQAFKGCDSLKSIIFENPDSVIIGKASGSIPASTVIYGYEGSTAQEYANIYNRTFIPLDGEPTNVITGTFTCEADDATAQRRGLAYPKEMQYPFTYSDSYFTESSYKYNHDLAKMSLSFAMAAFKGEWAEDLLTNETKCGFDKDSFYPCNYPIKTTDSIAVSFARKDIGEDYTLIAVGIRGGCYGAEWGGDFRVGDGKNTINHYGFDIAMNKVNGYFYNYLDNHCKDVFESGRKIKLWITGFSRGAATANLFSANLQNRADNFDQKGHSVKLEDIYTYTFETPLNTTDKNAKASKYNNIFNIVNPCDFVTKVAPTGWKFTRYGVNVTLPSPSETAGYSMKFAAMKSCYNKIADTQSNIYPYTADVSPRNLDEVLDDAFKQVSKDIIGSRKEYNKYESGVIKITQKLLGEGLKEEESKKLSEGLLIIKDKLDMKEHPLGTPLYFLSENLYDCLQHDVRLFLIDNQDTFGFNNDETANLARLVRDFVNELVYTDSDGFSIVFNDYYKGLFEKLTAEGSTLGYEIGHTHEAIVCMAWLDSLSSDQEWLSKYSNISGSSNKNTGKYRKIYINCPVDVNVYDSSNNLVGSIINDVSKELSGDHISTYIDNNGQKVLILPEDMEYRIEIKATANGSVSYTATEVSSDGETEKVVAYYDVDVNKGDVINGTAENLEKTDAKYPLTDKKGNKLTPDISKTDENIKEYSIDVSYEGHGAAFGGGVYLEGKYAQLSAIPAEKETFLGWYDGNDKLISKDNPYRFRVEKDMTVTAKFSSNYFPGDINNDKTVDTRDLTRLMKYLSGENVKVNEDALDVNGDKSKDARDLVRLMKYLSGDTVTIS